MHLRALRDGIKGDLLHEPGLINRRAKKGSESCRVMVTVLDAATSDLVQGLSGPRAGPNLKAVWSES